jgi:hypothetical protein
VYGFASPSGQARASSRSAALLVLAGILGTVVALALPAVRQVHEAAARAGHTTPVPARGAQPPTSPPADGGGGRLASLGHADSEGAATRQTNWGLNGIRKAHLGPCGSFACPYDPVAGAEVSLRAAPTAPSPRSIIPSLPQP